MPLTDSGKGLWGLGILLALGLIISAYLIGLAVKTAIPNHYKITVKGYNERKITSDYVTWQGNVIARASSLPKAYEKLEQDLSLILGYLKEQGVNEKDLHISSAQTSVYYKQTDNGTKTNDIEGYGLRYDFSVNSGNVLLISNIANQITSLIKDGLEIESYKPQYFYTKIDELKIDMLGEAAKDALARAVQLASNSGSQVGKLRSAQQGVFQITPAFSTTVSDYGENDTSTIEKSIKAVVTMEYGID
jgi:hypothetical protein